MLFDLRGAGRRRTVKVVYITLAFLMGGGLVLFGIGGDGLRRPGRRHHRARRRRRRLGPLPQAGDRGARAAPRPTRRTPPPGPRSPARASSSPASARTSTPRRARSPRPAAPSSRRAGDAWERYLALEPEEARRPRREPDGPGLRRAQPARRRRRRPRRSSPTPARRPSTFTQLAIFAYQAGQTRKGDLAKDKALELHRPGHARGAQGPARVRPSSRRPARPAQPSATP